MFVTTYAVKLRQFIYFSYYVIFVSFIIPSTLTVMNVFFTSSGIHNNNMSINEKNINFIGDRIITLPKIKQISYKYSEKFLEYRFLQILNKIILLFTATCTYVQL
jgi:hypothetical protein